MTEEHTDPHTTTDENDQPAAAIVPLEPPTADDLLAAHATLDHLTSYLWQHIDTIGFDSMDAPIEAKRQIAVWTDFLGTHSEPHRLAWEKMVSGD